MRIENWMLSRNVQIGFENTQYIKGIILAHRDGQVYVNEHPGNDDEGVTIEGGLNVVKANTIIWMNFGNIAIPPEIG